MSVMREACDVHDDAKTKPEMYKDHNCTYVFVSCRVANQILDDMLCCACTHSSSAPRTCDRELRPAALAWIHALLLPLALCAATNFAIAEHR